MAPETYPSVTSHLVHDARACARLRSVGFCSSFARSQLFLCPCTPVPSFRGAGARRLLSGRSLLSSIDIQSCGAAEPSEPRSRRRSNPTPSSAGGGTRCASRGPAARHVARRAAALSQRRETAPSARSRSGRPSTARAAGRRHGTHAPRRRAAARGAAEARRPSSVRRGGWGPQRRASANSRLRHSACGDAVRAYPRSGSKGLLGGARQRLSCGNVGQGVVQESARGAMSGHARGRATRQ